MTVTKDWIQTHPSCRKFYPLTPSALDIDVDDIINALSHLCRYNGHVERFYSVAEHSVHVSRIVFERTGSLWVASWGLWHDASEAYLQDIPRPVKRQPELAAYRDAEKVMQRVICLTLGLGTIEPQIVGEVDTEILGTEARQLKDPVHPDWGKTTATGELPAALPLGRLGWSPARARREFRGRLAWIEWMYGRDQAPQGSRWERFVERLFVWRELFK